MVERPVMSRAIGLSAARFAGAVHMSHTITSRF